MFRYVVSIDFGDSAEPTAIGVVEPGVMRGPGGALVPRYDLVHAERRSPTEDTSWRSVNPRTGRKLEFYPAVIDVVSRLLRASPIFDATAQREVAIVIDGTSCGLPIVQMFREAVRDLRGLTIYPIKLVAGGKPHPGGDGFIHVPKKYLADTVQAVLQSERLRLASALRVGGVDLARQLRKFRVRITGPADQLIAAREGDDDDLVLMVAQALFVGETWGSRQPGGQVRIQFTRSAGGMR